MKIHDILSEAPEYTTPGGIVIPSGSKTAAPTTTGTDWSQYDKPAYQRANKAAPKTTSLKPGAKAAANVATGSASGKSASPKVKKLFENLKGRISMDTVKIRGKEVKFTELPKVAQAITKISVVTIKILKWVNFINFLYQWLATKEVIEDMDTNEHAFGPGEKDIVLRLAFEDLVMSMAASQVMSRFIVWFLRIIQVGRAAEAIAGGVLAIFTGGLAVPEEILFFIGQEAVLIALQQWMQSPEGRKLIASIVISLDPVMTSVYNALVGNFFGKIKSLGTDSGKAAAQKALGAPQNTLIGNAGNPSAANGPTAQTDPRTDNTSNGDSDSDGKSNTAPPAGKLSADEYAELQRLRMQAYQRQWGDVTGTPPKN